MTISVGDLIHMNQSMMGLTLTPEEDYILMVLNTDYTGKRPNGSEIISGWLVLCPDGTTDIIGQGIQSYMEKIET